MIYSGRHSSIYFLITLMYCNLVRHEVESNLYSEFNNELDKVSNYAENRAKAETLATMGEIYDHNGELLRKHLQNIQFKDMRNANKLNRNAEIGKLINVLSPYHEPWPGIYPSSKQPLRSSRESFAQDSHYTWPTKRKTLEIREILPRAYKSEQFKKYGLRNQQMQRKKRFEERPFDPKTFLNTAASEYPNVIANLLGVQKFNGMKDFSPSKISNQKNTGYSIREVQDALQQQSVSRLLNTPLFGPDIAYDSKIRSVSMVTSPPEQNGQTAQQSSQIPQQSSQIPQQSNQTPQQNNQTFQQNSQLFQQNEQMPPKFTQLFQQSSQIPQQSSQIPQQSGQIPQQSSQIPPQNSQIPPQNSQIPPQNSQIPQGSQILQQFSQTCQQPPDVQPNPPKMLNQSPTCPVEFQQIPNQDRNLSQPPQMADLKGALEKVLNELEGIKQCNNDTEITPDGIPCNIMGSWNSEVLGLRFDISFDERGLNVGLQERTPPRRHTIMDADWSCTGGSLKKLGGPFFITAEKSEENKMAVFSGLCKKCGGADTIFGSWTVIHPSKGCEDVQLAIETKRDVFRRNNLPKKKKLRLEKIYKARSKAKDS